MVFINSRDSSRASRVKTVYGSSANSQGTSAANMPGHPVLRLGGRLRVLYCSKFFVAA